MENEIYSLSVEFEVIDSLTESQNSTHFSKTKQSKSRDLIVNDTHGADRLYFCQEI